MMSPEDKAEVAWQRLSPEDKAETAWQRLGELEALLESRDQRIKRLEEERVALEALVDRLREASWGQQERIARLRTVVAMTAKHFPHTRRFKAALDSLKPGDFDG